MFEKRNVILLVLVMFLTVVFTGQIFAGGGGQQSSPPASAPAATPAAPATQAGGAVPKPANYPSKPIRWIVPAAAGAPIDLPSRALAEILSLGQSVVVENMAGANQTLGTAEAARRDPDGYTLLTMANACGIAQPLITKLTYKVSDFRHIAMLSPTVTATILVRADSSLNSIEDFLKLLNSGKPYAYGVPNAGGYGHLAIANVLNQLGKFDDPNGTFVAYNGGPEAVMSVLNRETDFAVIDDIEAFPKVQNKEAKVIAILHNETCALFPDVKLISNHGIKGTETFIGLRWISVRKEVPEPIVAWLKQEINKVLVSKAYQDILAKMGFGPMRVYSEKEVTDIIAAAAVDYEAVLKNLGLIK